MSERVLTGLREAIVSGELAPGSLHSVATLAAQLQVSRTPVREALIKLEQQRMVRFERNRGVRVLQTTMHDLGEVFALRLLLEVPATRHASSQLTPAGLKELRGHYQGMQRAAAAGDEFRMMDRDRRFHRCILAASGNLRLAEYVDSLRDLVLKRGASTAGRSRSLDDITAEHREVLERLESREAAAAAEAMRRHLVHTAQLLISQEHDGELDPTAATAAFSWTLPG